MLAWYFPDFLDIRPYEVDVYNFDSKVLTVLCGFIFRKV